MLWNEIVEEIVRNEFGPDRLPSSIVTGYLEEHLDIQKSLEECEITLSKMTSAERHTMALGEYEDRIAIANKYGSDGLGVFDAIEDFAHLIY